MSLLTMLSKLIHSRISILIAIALACYVAYYLLLRDNYLHTSIASIIQYSHTVALNKHLLILGLLPIYIAVIIFGAAMLGLYLGSTVQMALMRVVRNK